MDSMYVRKPACPNKYYWFLLVLKSVSPIIIVGMYMQYASRSNCYITFKIRQKGIHKY